MKFYAADAEIEKLVQDRVDTKQAPEKFLNNYSIFVIGNYIKGQAVYHLTRRRKIACHRCDAQCKGRPNLPHSNDRFYG